MKYVYPAILTQEDDGIIVSFPDVEGERADGASIEEALENADDVLNLMLLTMEEKHLNIKSPTPIASLDVPKGSTVALVRADTLAYSKKLIHELLLLLDTSSARKEHRLQLWGRCFSHFVS